jgi:hypothetical protein
VDEFVAGVCGDGPFHTKPITGKLTVKMLFKGMPEVLVFTNTKLDVKQMMKEALDAEILALGLNVFW